MPRLPPSVLPWVTGLSVATVLVAIWLGLRENEARALELSTRAAATQAAPRLADFVAARLTVVESLARERAQNDDMHDADFVRRAQILEASFGGLLAINWIDPSGVIRIAVPEGPNRSAIGRSVRKHPEAAPFFLEAEREGTPVLTSSLVLYQGPRGVVSYFPVRRNGRLLGYVNGVFDCGKFVETSLKQGVLDRYLLRVTDQAGTLFESPQFGLAGNPRGQADARVAGQMWRVALEPSPALRAASHSRGVDLLLLLALVLGGAVWWLTRGWLERRRTLQLLAEERRHLEHQMIEAQKLEAIGLLAGGVAHDFNNLLTAMMGHAELARRSDNLSDEVRADLGVIIDAAHRGAEITRDLLTFSRKEVVHPRAFDVAEEVQRLRPMLNHLLREDIRLEEQIDPSVGCVLMDPSQLERALMNLVVNAVDAQPDGGRVEITVKQGENGVIGVAVTDDGEGMSDDVAARAFEPFFTTKSAGKGTGLGLASVYGMARQVGGDVSLQTEVGKGTTVTLLLPRVVDLATERQTPSASPLRAPSGEQILLVEDDLPVRKAAERILARAEYNVVAASSAEEALALVAAGAAPAVLVTDEVMPGLRGHALEELRLTLPRLRVLVCSGHAEDLIDVRMLKTLQAGFLQKPYTPTQLVEALENLPSPMR